MASTIKALIEQAEALDEMKMAGECTRDEVHELAPRQRPFVALAKVHSPMPEKPRVRRNAFDKRLLVSFGSISPAYLFSAFPIKS
jgi:hypothetical protein